MTPDLNVYAKQQKPAPTLVAWRIRKTRSDLHRQDVDRQLLKQLHTDKAN